MTIRMRVLFRSRRQLVSGVSAPHCFIGGRSLMHLARRCGSVRRSRPVVSRVEVGFDIDRRRLGWRQTVCLSVNSSKLSWRRCVSVDSFTSCFVTFLSAVDFASHAPSQHFCRTSFKLLPFIHVRKISLFFASGVVPIAEKQYAPFRFLPVIRRYRRSRQMNRQTITSFLNTCSSK